MTVVELGNCLLFLLYLVGPLAIACFIHRATGRWDPMLRGGSAILVLPLIWLGPACDVVARGGEPAILAGGVFIIGVILPLLLTSIVMLIWGGVRRLAADRPEGD
jgi:hypothetical protein